MPSTMTYIGTEPDLSMYSIDSFMYQPTPVVGIRQRSDSEVYQDCRGSLFLYEKTCTQLID